LAIGCESFKKINVLENSWKIFEKKNGIAKYVKKKKHLTLMKNFYVRFELQSTKFKEFLKSKAHMKSKG
jgi:hypothetical protein